MLHKKTLEQLDYYRIRDTIAGYCVSEEGKASLLKREPFTQEKLDEINRLNTFAHIYLARLKVIINHND